MVKTVRCATALAVLCGVLVQHAAADKPLNEKDIRSVPTVSLDGPRLPGEGGSIVNVNLDGTFSWDSFGSPNNVIVDLDLASLIGQPSGTPLQVDGIGWEGSIQTFGGSWVSEAAIDFNNAIFLRPGAGINQPEPTPVAVSTGGIIDLAGNGLPAIAAPTGILSLQFYETFDDAADTIDAEHVTAELTLAISPFDPPPPPVCELEASGDTTGLPTWNRPSSLTTLSGVGTDTPYEVIEFVPDRTTEYDFANDQSDGTPDEWDGVMLLYEGSFDPMDQLTNLIAYNDDGAGSVGTSDFSAALSAGVSYFIVTTGFANDDFGPYTVTVCRPVPEPAGLALLCGVALFGASYFRRMA